MKIDKLVVNESYWSLFTEKEMTSQNFIVPDVNNLDLDILGTNEYLRGLACLMKSMDTNKQAIYGIEIKTNGSNRTKRIQLARLTGKHQSIYKLVRDLKSFEAGIIDLKDLEYHLLKSRTSSELSMPDKIILIGVTEVEFKTSKYKDYMINIANKSKVSIISVYSLKEILSDGEYADFDSKLSACKIV